LALGRQMTQLYVAVAERFSLASGQQPSRHFVAGQHPPPPDATAGLGPLDREGLFELRLLAVKAALHRIAGVAADAGLVMPTAEDLIAQGPKLAGEAGRQSVVALHKQLIEVLGASAPPMGTAYELGTALAGLCEATCRNAAEFEAAVNAGRIDRIRDLISRLQSILPPHSAQAVHGALNNWEDWLHAHQPIQWERDGAQIATALNAQGGEWFSLLEGQKAAIDLLSVDNYVTAGEALLRQYRNLAKRFAAQWWPYMVGGLVVAGAIVAGLFFFGHGATKGIGTIVTLLATVGVTAKTATSTLEKTASNVENSLWQAELDNAIVYAATSLPAGTPPIVMPVTRPLQRKQRMAADEARAARHHAIAGRAAQRSTAAAGPVTPSPLVPPSSHEGQ
ncbi:MAG: hypothetical protein M3083_20805, partial [Actinomycetota bacterium]|nr:hypothetical protein [Actinomycetota bacterium]